MPDSTVSESSVQKDIEVRTSELSHINESWTPEPADIPSDSENVDSADMSSESENVESHTDQSMGSRYELPPRSTRGIPPKRYDPEFESQRSKYPVNKARVGILSIQAKTFNTTLYSEDIPNTTEEALRSENWRSAMEEEINALIRNNTWEKCTLPTGKRPVGCK